MREHGVSLVQERCEHGTSLVPGPGSPLVHPNTSHAVVEPALQPRTALSQWLDSVILAQCN